MSICGRSRIFSRKIGRMSRPLVTVVDVYELATDMGKEIEQIMDLYGADAVTRLMPKVINTLELLESFATINEEENSRIDDLQNKVAQLESEKLGKAEDRVKFEKELEQIEEDLRDENRDLIELVARLQEENRKLNNSLSEKEGSVTEIGCQQEQDIVILQKLNHVLEQQRRQLRIKDSELQEKILESELFQNQLERITKANKELHRKQRNSQMQSRALIEEKAELQAQIQDQQRELQALKDNLGSTRKRSEEMMKVKSPTMPNLSSKTLYDADDPDRPRFTMNELRKILFERNELKAKVSELQDELALYRPKKSPLPDDEAPVQGPINKEPDDAPWKKQESGIRKLFRVLFGDPSEGSKSNSARSSPTFATYKSSPEARAILH